MNALPAVGRIDPEAYQSRAHVVSGLDRRGDIRPVMAEDVLLIIDLVFLT
jgi:hypothetical protein